MDEHVVVAGASGLVGRSALEHFARSGVRTTGLSQRRPWDGYGSRIMELDLADERACAETLSGMTDVTQVIFAALHEEDDLVSGWLADRHVKRNALMLRNLVDVLDRSSPTLRNIVLLQGPRVYGVHVGRVLAVAREDRDEARDVANFYWAQEDYLRAKQVGRSWGWTIFRPALVVGMAIGGAMNLIAVIGVYAAILRERGQPLAWPGRADMLREATDTELMARAFEWAGHSDAARNQVFNITNGEMFSLKAHWPLIAGEFGMEVGEDAPVSLANELSSAAAEWDAIRCKFGLRAPALSEFLSQSSQFAEFAFGRAVADGPPTSVMSTVKLRQAGFHETLHTDAMLRKWFDRYQSDRLLPS